MRLISAAAVALMLSCIAAPLVHAAPSAALRPEPPRADSAALQERLTGSLPLILGNRTLDLAALQRLYAAGDYALIWAGQPERVKALAAAAAAAVDDGLDIAVPPAAAREDAVDRDLLLSDTALRLATALAVGRADAEEWEEDWAIAPPRFDAVSGLHHALAADRLGLWLAGLAPMGDRYLRLKGAYAHYRELAQAGGWPRIPNGPTIKPGMTDPRVPILRRRLAIEGYLSADSDSESPTSSDTGAAAAADIFAPTLEAAVRLYQARNGIVVDGAVGPRTLAALDVPVKMRVEQIALNLERWRELPRDFGKDYVFVNVPGERLDVVQDGVPVMTMKVVVGDPEHPTPVVLSRIAALTINPPWRVPLSIGLKEILPKVKADRRYLARNKMVMKGAYYFEQLPGPRNPLGRLKFETPNKFDVYLHDTPSRGTFERAARALSHGCVRMEDARELANYVLDPVKWTAADLIRAIDSGRTVRVGVMRRLRVALLYFTSFVDPDGVVEFRDDIYGRDKRLRLALKGEPPAPALKIEASR